MQECSRHGCVRTGSCDPDLEKFNAYADKVEAQMKEAGIRCSVDRRSEKMGYKIREARLERVPYMLVVGAKEEEESKVSVRSRYLGDEGMKELENSLQRSKEEIKTKQSVRSKSRKRKNNKKISS